MGDFWKQGLTNSVETKGIRTAVVTTKEGKIQQTYPKVTGNLVRQKESYLYKFTNGYIDQKGGTENKKFFALPFRELLKEISSLSSGEQKEILTQKHVGWKGNNEQLDDILIIGIRV